MRESAEIVLDYHQIKENFKTALKSKGVDLTNVPFTQYPEKLNEIQTGGGGENKLAKLVLNELTKITESDLEGVTIIKDYAFYNCTALTSITLPNTITSIKRDAFNGCKGLTSITLPNTITSIDYQVFANCISLTSITIPSSITTFGNSVFVSCSNLEKVVYKGQAPKITTSLFGVCSKVTLYDFRNCKTVPALETSGSLGHATGCQIVIPDSLYNTWTTASRWVSLTDVVWVKASEYVES